MTMRESELKNCYCFDRSFKRDAAKVEALNRFEQEERMSRDQPRAASVRLVEPRDAPYFWALIVINDLDEAKVSEAVDPGSPADPMHGRLSFPVFLNPVPLLLNDSNRLPPLEMPAIEKRRLECHAFRFGDSDFRFSVWLRVT
jgi:hypothetical protein